MSQAVREEHFGHQEIPEEIVSGKFIVSRIKGRNMAVLSIHVGYTVGPHKKNSRVEHREVEVTSKHDETDPGRDMSGFEWIDGEPYVGA